MTATVNARGLQYELRRVRHLYLDVMERYLTGRIYQDRPLSVKPGSMDQEYDDRLREYGWDWPSLAHTMIGQKRLRNLRRLVENVIWNRVPGDLIETGVWRGGACIMMRAVLQAYSVKDRRVWVADSFEGLPPPDVERFPKDAGQDFHTFPELAVPLETVKENFARYGLLDDQVVFLKGWFRETLAKAEIEKLALMRLDGDLYESTFLALEHLFDKLSPGGYVIVDDYRVVDACRAAVSDFLSSRGLTPKIMGIDGVGVCWRKDEKDG